MLNILPLTIPDIPAARRLSDLAGWNHLDTDWHRLITLWPDTAIAGWLDNQLIATATLAMFGPGEGHLAWVGVMLVDPAHRGAGHGGAMFDAILRLGEQFDVSNFGLDATDMGRPLYAKRHFDDRFLMHRWKCATPPGFHHRNFAPPIRALSSKDWPQLLALDRAASGLDRSKLLHRIAEERAVHIVVADSAAGLAGFAILRPGRVASYIGPLVAKDAGTASALLTAALQAHNNPALPIFIDTAEKPALEPALLASGFTIARTLTRMARATPNHPLAYTNQVYAIAGLELC